MLSYPMRLLSHRRTDTALSVALLPTTSRFGSSTLRAVCTTMFVGLLFCSTSGCQRIFTMPNSMCPPQYLTGQRATQNQLPPRQHVHHPSTQGFATVTPALNPTVVDDYAASLERQQSLPSVPPDNFPDQGPPTPPTLADDGSRRPDHLGLSVSDMMKIFDKLHVANAENAKLREKIAKVQEEKQEKEKLAFKATEFAEQLRSENMQLQSDLKAWEDRIGQLEDLFAQRQTQQEDVLIDLGGKLDDMISEYEADRSNTTTLNTSVP